MFALFFAVVTFYVVPISFPKSYGTIQLPSTDTPASIAANGNIALTLWTGAHHVPSIGILRADGSTTILPLPPLSENTHRSQYEDRPYFGQLILARDGTPFASVWSCHDGVGGGGCYKTLFVWTGFWHPLPHPKSDAQFDIVGAITLGTYVLEDDNSLAITPGYKPASSAYRYGTSRYVELGGFEAKAMCGSYLVGTDSYGYNLNAAVPPKGPATQHAIEYSGSVRRLLGVGVAMAVNASGDVVGDDESSQSSGGRPMRWTNGRAILLSNAQGTADAISDSGLILGTANGHVFLTDEHDSSHHLYQLENLLTEKKWQIQSEFGIASSGRIVVAASRGGGPVQMVLLDPVRT